MSTDAGLVEKGAPAEKDVALIGTLNDVQRACVTNVSGPLLVSAGAGSGKTFMLTRRIAYALLHPELSGVREVDQDVLAITFTELAAAEIKARVRSTLRSIGMVDAALKVDSSWISTIHGMCSRILHEHALELGLDPAFTLLDDTDRSRLLLESVSEAIAEVAQVGQGDDQTCGSEDDAGEAGDPGAAGLAAAPAEGYEALFGEYQVDAVKEMVVKLLDEASSVQGGLDALCVGPAPLGAQDIARDVHEAMTQMEGAAHLYGIDHKGRQDAFAKNTLDALVGNPGGIARFEALAASQDVRYEDVAEALGALNPKFAGRNLGKSAEKRAAYASWLVAFDRACGQCVAGLVARPRDELLALARRAQGIFDRKKAELGCLDQNDLLLKTLHAFRTNARVAQEFHDKFKLVMVDEFQDTSALQIAIIEFLDGDGDARLCTVGDTQQSIYRFRGADVDTYRAHKHHMREEVKADYRELGVNYRSHGDIITFVNRLFSQERVFGSGADSEFIELGFNPDRPSSIPQGLPRIDATFVVSRNSGPKQPAPSTADRRKVEARVICDRFCAYHEAGVAWKDMVVLLGTMSHADVYADELRAHGIPCVIAGGSIFDRAIEARTVCSLARAIANPLDDDALASVLASDMFGLDPDEVLLAATDSHGRHRRHLWGGLRHFADGAPTPRLHLAAHTLRDAVDAAAQSRPSTVLTNALVESGWFDRLYEQGPEGTAQAANILKAVRLAQTIESDPRRPRGMASVADRMATKFAEGMKEAPGALNVRGSDAVRIMTIHASKGLEFPVVALGEFWKPGVERDTLKTETVGETIHLYLEPGRSFKKHGRFGDLATRRLSDADYQKWAVSADLADDGLVPATDPADACDPVDFRRAVKAHAKASELAELRRKFYVGATRPREALVIVCEAGQDKERLAGSPEAEGTFGSAAEVLEDLARAFYSGGAPLADSPEGIEFGGSMRAICRKIQIELDLAALGGCGQRRVHIVGKPLSDYLLSDSLGSEAYRIEAAAYAASGNHMAENPVGNGPLLPATLDDYAAGGELAGRMNAGTGDGPEDANTVPAGSHGDGARMRIPEPIDIRNLMPLQIPCDTLHAGTFSYSSIAHADDEADETEGTSRTSTAADLDGRATPGDIGQQSAGAPGEAGRAGTTSVAHTPTTEIDPDEILPPQDAVLGMDGSADIDPPIRRANWFDPTAFGSAFHTAAQWMAEVAIARRGTAESLGTASATSLPGTTVTTGSTADAGTSRVPDVAGAPSLPGTAGAAGMLGTASATGFSVEPGPLNPSEPSGHMGLPIARPCPDLPGPSRLAQIARTWGLGESALPRLRGALERWHGSDVARQAYAHSRIEPEAPFYVTLLGPQGEPLHLEGSIDLLCTANGTPTADQRAFVVDYKTGGASSETADLLHQKHLLQAQCYAYAVLSQGYAEVDLAFVRVEADDPDMPGQPQVVRYSFEGRDRDALAELIRDAYRRSRARGDFG